MRTLITGAGGFIGGRTVEILHASGFADVRAGIRRWSTAARIGRLPVEIVQCDIMDPTGVEAALDGMDTVIHCAVGSKDVTIEGTRNLLQGALEARIDRFVHISTIDVYGDSTGEVDETHPYVRTGAEYGDAKIEAEELCWEYREKGLAVSVLRPTIVYGPFSTLWTEEFAERLQQRPWPFPEALCAGTCNLVYVDDLVAAMKLALTSAGAVGEGFNINGPDRPTWYQYFEVLNHEMGLPAIQAQAPAASRSVAWAMKPVRAGARWSMNRFGDQIMSIYKSSDLAKKVMKFVEGMIRRSPTTGEFDLYGKELSIPTEKAARLLGYEPAVDMDDGVRLSVQWLRHHGFLGAEGWARETSRG